MLATQDTHSFTDILLDEFNNFSKAAEPLLHIHSETAYQKALDTLDDLFDRATDSPDDPLNPLIDMLSNAITQYEDSLPAVQKMDKRIEDMDAGLSTLRTLMSQYGLSGSDFENEIGKRAYVSQILSGSRKLSKDHIKKLSDRFSVSPSLFF